MSRSQGLWPWCHYMKSLSLTVQKLWSKFNILGPQTDTHTDRQTDRQTERQTEQKQDAPEFYSRGIKVHPPTIIRDIKLQGVYILWESFCSSLLIMFSLLEWERVIVCFSTKKNQEYKCTDDICQQSIYVQAHSMANIFWTSCLQSIKSKNKYFLIHIHVYLILMLQTNVFNRTSTSHKKKWFYAILFRYACITVISVKNSNVKENTKPRKATNLTNLPYIGNFSRREILVKMRIRRCIKFSPSPIFAISMTLNEDVEFIFLCLFLAVSGRSRTHQKLNPREKFPIYGKLAKSINTCTWNMATEASDCLKHIGVCRNCI